MKDSFARSIDYLRLSITDLCNLRCRYCMPPEGVEKKEHARIFRIEELVELAEAAAALGIRKVRLTGGEPLVRKGVLSLVEGIKAIPGIETLSLTTNGLLLTSLAGDLKRAGLNRVNISLDTLKAERFHHITRLDLFEQVMTGIREALEAGLTPLKINAVLIKGFNDDEIPSFADLARELDIEVRFIELMPLGQASSWADRHYLSNQAVFDALPGLIPLEETEPGSPAEVWSLPGGRGRIGVINPISHKFCGDCNRLRVTAEGRLLPCLHSNLGVDIRTRRAEGASFEEILREGALLKPREHQLDQTDRVVTENNMHMVGG